MGAGSAGENGRELGRELDSQSVDMHLHALLQLNVPCRTGRVLWHGEDLPLLCKQLYNASPQQLSVVFCRPYSSR
jgi:hypothetical protein